MTTRSRRTIVWAAGVVALLAAIAATWSIASRADTSRWSSTLTVAGRASSNVSLASDGPSVVAVWSASLPAGDTDIFAATSADSGRTFSAPVRVNSTPGDARVNGEQPPRVALRKRANASPDIVVVWTTKGSSGTRMLQSTSRDGGKTFSPSTVVPGTDAPGNRGWEAVGTGPDGRFFSVWLDHRKLAPPEQAQTAAEHQHGAHATGAMSSGQADGVAMAQLSQLYVAPLDGSIAPQGVTGGVCYCCKTAIATGSGNTLYLAWRHVYANNMRDIAFTVSRDGGRTYAPPVRVSEDKWQIDGCPDDGPAMAVDSGGTVHIVWPSVVTERGGPVKALFHAMTRDGRTFTPRERIPTAGQANHPQLAIDPADTLAVTWDESGSGTRTLAAATGRVTGSGAVTFTRLEGTPTAGTYPDLTATASGRWLRASTSVEGGQSRIRLDQLP